MKVGNEGSVEPAQFVAVTPGRVEAHNACGASAGLAWSLLDPYRSRETQRKGQAMRELNTVVCVSIDNPTERLCLLPGRRLNPWVSLAEFPWLMAGRNDVAWLRPYLPRAAEFSDDGTTWRAGYGPRLRRWGGSAVGHPIDQLAEVVAVLRRDPGSRQAVISLWDPALDLNVRSRDIPCTNWLHFQINHGRLDLTVVMRSNDLIWGFSGVNVVNFTLLQELVAAILGVGLGSYQHVCTNMHCYSARHLHLVQGMESSVDPYPALRAPGHSGRSIDAIDLHEFTEECCGTLWSVDALRRALPPVLPSFQHGWLGDWAYFMLLHSYATSGPDRDGDYYWWWEALARVRNDGWRLAAAAWLARRSPDRHGRLLESTALALMGDSNAASYMEAFRGDQQPKHGGRDEGW